MSDRTRLASLELKWLREGKSPAARAKLRYYYRNRTKILEQYRSNKYPRDVFNIYSVLSVRNVPRVIEL